MHKIYMMWIRKTHQDKKFKMIPVKAKDSIDAIRKLPECVSWDFSNIESKIKKY